MISIKLINLFLVCLGFTTLMIAFAYQIKSLKIRFSGMKMFRFYFLLACLGIICREVWILRYDKGLTVQIWNLWAVIISYFLIKYQPFKIKDKISNHDTSKVQIPRKTKHA